MSRRPGPDPQVLLPAPGRPAAALPPGIGLLGVLGLVILLSSTLPSLRQHLALQRAHQRLAREVAETAARTEARRQELRGAGQESFLRARAQRQLLAQGARYLRERDARLARARAAAPAEDGVPAPAR